MADINGADADTFGVKCAGRKNAVTEPEPSRAGPAGMNHYGEEATGIATAEGCIIAVLHSPDGNGSIGINMTRGGYSGEDDDTLDGADKLAESRAVTPDFYINGKVAEAGVRKRIGCVDKFSYRSALDQGNDTFSRGTSRLDKDNKKERSEGEDVLNFCFH